MRMLWSSYYKACYDDDDVVELVLSMRPCYMYDADDDADNADNADDVFV